MDLLSISWGNVIIPQLIAKAIIIFCCFPIHECAHAWMAAKLGDPTGEREGRITFNPFKHLDLWGTIMLLAFGLGYAKPVSVSTYYFRKPKRDYAIVSLAGPMANLIMAVSLLFVGHVIVALAGDSTGNGTFIVYLILCLKYAAYINFGLTVFNLIPLPPMDGYHAIMMFVPYRFYYRISKLERYSVYIILGLLFIFTLFGVSPITIATQGLYNAVNDLYSQLLNH